MRLDLIDPVISGNKPFKLSEYISSAKNSGHRGMVTFGGAWSNHIHATAYATRLAGMKSIGIIRGERPAILSPTLSDAEQAGMELRFISRTDYKDLRDLRDESLEEAFPGYTLVPEGGAGKPGMRGAAGIMEYIPSAAFDWIVCACGTGTTLAGLISATKVGQQFLGISVLKGHTGLKSDINGMLKYTTEYAHFEVIDRFHGGGYAKYDDELVNYMNDFHYRTGIPTDIIYTGKLMRAIDMLFQEGFFPPDVRVLAIHSGGLQGNRSLSPGRLHFS
jgi:1-aminocyclopropane-1-carboxylate deaminase